MLVVPAVVNQKVGYRDATIQPYPHLDITTNEKLMPECGHIGEMEDET